MRGRAHLSEVEAMGCVCAFALHSPRFPFPFLRFPFVLRSLLPKMAGHVALKSLVMAESKLYDSSPEASIRLRWASDPSMSVQIPMPISQLVANDVTDVRGRDENREVLCELSGKARKLSHSPSSSKSR